MLTRSIVSNYLLNERRKSKMIYKRMNKYMISMIMSIKHTCTNLTTYTFKWLLKLYQSFITISDTETQN